MPTDRKITDAVKQLGRYFQATTDAAYIDQTWSFQTTFEENRPSLADPSAGVEDRIKSFGNLTRNISYTEGTTTADLIANLVHGSMCISSFIDTADLDGYDPTQFEFYAAPPKGKQDDPPQVTFTKLNKVNKPQLSVGPMPSIENPNLYAMAVKNPFISPMVRNTGAVEVFMNSIPTLEFSKCVPYINIELISTLRTFGTTTPQLTMLGFLNPPSVGAADDLILSASSVPNVKSEATDLGRGVRSGIELFTMPQTLVNMGQTGPEFVPIIDRLRPLATLNSLSLNTKLQGGILSFVTGRMEITIHDRSRLRDVAAFVRPDLYGTTFLDITHGWSHPDGGLGSNNVFGQFLDALKSQSRFRISNASFTFEDGGQVKITLSIQTVGSIDLLYLGPRNSGSPLQQVKQIVELVNRRLIEINARKSNPSMTQYDFLGNINDPSSLFAVASSKDFLKKVRELQTNKQTDQQISDLLAQLVGVVSSKSETPGGLAAAAIKESQENYTTIIDGLPTFGDDDFSRPFLLDNDGNSTNRMELLGTNRVVGTPSNSQKEIVGEIKTPTKKSIDASGVYAEAGTTASDYLSLGSVFMRMVAQPLIDSKQYDEIQVIFYPFNRYAGAVHGLPVSCFPIEKGRFKASISDIAKTVAEITGRDVVKLLNERFVNFQPARPYLMTGFYEEKSIEEGKAEIENVKNEAKVIVDGIEVKFVPNISMTQEERMRAAGIPEGRLQLPRIEVAVEGCRLLDHKGDQIPESGQAKTLLKIHVYDASMDPYSTLSEIITSAKDNELGVIQVPTAEFNKNNNPVTQLSALEVIQKGLELGVLEAVSKDKLNVVQFIDASQQKQKELLDSILQGSTFVRVKGDYESIKRIVAAGMPTIIYGSSTSTITQASITTAGSSAMATVMMQNAFNSPGEAATENVQSGVPMQILPVQLSMNTIGCPLFVPMQRMFIDFGTGTSLDSCYYIVESNSSIGQDGYKTDLKMAYSAGFPTYQSLNTQLARLSTNFASITNTSPTPITTETLMQNAAEYAAAQREIEAEIQRQREMAEKKLKKGLKQTGKAAKDAADAEKARVEAEAAQRARDLLLANETPQQRAAREVSEKVAAAKALGAQKKAEAQALRQKVVASAKPEESRTDAEWAAINDQSIDDTFAPPGESLPG